MISELLDTLRWAACAGNEYNNHDAINKAKADVEAEFNKLVALLRDIITNPRNWPEHKEWHCAKKPCEWCRARTALQEYDS